MKFFFYTQKIKSIATSVLLFLLLMSCSTEPTTKQEKVLVSLPNTPETVSKQWQNHLDKNEIEQAAALSTESTKAWLEENKEIFLNEDETDQTIFIKMNCVTTGEKATCHYTIQEEAEEELIEDYFILAKINGQWLVDLEEDNSTPELDEQIFKEMEKELNLSQ